MYIIGVDISRDELVAVSMTKRAAVEQRWKVPNTSEGIGGWLSAMPYSHFVVGCEATAEYHVAISRICLARGITLKLLNPIVTKQFTRATVRKRKTDMTDAEAIARCVLHGEGYSITDGSLSPAKRFLRTAEKMRRFNQSLRRMAKQMEDFVTDADTSALYAAARHTEDAERALRAQGIVQASPEAVKLLQSIPGIGATLAPTIVAEIGDLSRFETAEALVAFAGLDPRVRQSGAILARSGKLTKRGSPYLRRALFIAASVAQRYDPELAAYYEKKRSEGKRFTQATVANSRHITRRVFAVLKRGTPYVRRELSTA